MMYGSITRRREEKGSNAPMEEGGGLEMGGGDDCRLLRLWLGTWGESSLLRLRLRRVPVPRSRSCDLRWIPSHSCSCSDCDLGRVWLLGRPPLPPGPSPSHQSSSVSSDHDRRDSCSKQASAHLA